MGLYSFPEVLDKIHRLFVVASFLSIQHTDGPGRVSAGPLDRITRVGDYAEFHVQIILPFLIFIMRLRGVEFQSVYNLMSAWTGKNFQTQPNPNLEW